ncbi:hypothetical protein NX059_011158 [Plenodomus lindquistii]|nr:hypothetical protein NX059_011158 [Plenodomus lindquistii]
MPSEPRGLRTSTGCLTCRKRRIKCDEARPGCGNCARVKRECRFPEKSETSSRSRPKPRPRKIRAPPIVATPPSPAATTPSVFNPKTSPATTPIDTISIPTPESIELGPGWDPLQLPDSMELAQSWDLLHIPDIRLSDQPTSDDGTLLDDISFTFDTALMPDLGPVEWYNSLAEDAFGNIQEHRFDESWNSSSCFPSETPIRPCVDSIRLPTTHSTNGDNGIPYTSLTLPTQPWISESRIELQQDELAFFDHYINAVAPILDLFDPAKHFAKMVPHMALSNRGLMKSLLAVAACHMALGQSPGQNLETVSAQSPSALSLATCVSSRASKIADQYYYDTLRYLSQHIMDPTYRSSHELLVTAILISTYDMFNTRTDFRSWDRHLRRAFWIQRNAGVSGESPHSLERAVWCAWMRQDTLAAFCTGRPALTLHQPTIPLSSLSVDGLHQRIIYIAAKCVQFAARPKEDRTIARYIEVGETLMKMLEAWKQALPPSFEPVLGSAPTASSSIGSPSEPDPIRPIWIHPPENAAAIQLYHFSKIVTVLNQPSMGGLASYQTSIKILRESAAVIYGIAIAQQSQNLPSAFVSLQAVHAATLCAETLDRQDEIFAILDQVLMLNKHPDRSFLDNLINVWGSASGSGTSSASLYCGN